MQTAENYAEFQAWRQQQIKETGIDPVAQMYALGAAYDAAMAGFGALVAGGENSAPAMEAATSGEAGWVRVGRWMSTEELAKMEGAGTAIESSTLWGARVALPASADAYRGAPDGSFYVEHDIPAGVAKPAGSGWARISEPNSVEGRAAAAAGRPAPAMPPVRNIKVVKTN